ncbi:hypothetical protein A9G13_07675 [Gilliamella sp. wkB178]|uniref:MmcQ/YjbR family DNA-binding protein n=1 Tax=Gilliamella sp. wkB178 TaxID=3120259 RepID=UPI00080E3884|nr:MmcQ/YjbR family DNA-binding protein [Gilliamella apicola]OCG08067.1 hypothetical protein A9G13_07675 [Gilliamella apicola]
MLAKYQWIEHAALKLKGAEIVYKPEWRAFQFLIADKMFAYAGKNNHNQDIITLKGDPANNRLMIEMYDNITEGYYANKIHWISIILNTPNPLDQAMVIDLLKQSYNLVFAKLTKKSQQQIINSIK